MNSIQFYSTNKVTGEDSQLGSNTTQEHLYNAHRQQHNVGTPLPMPTGKQHKFLSFLPLWRSCNCVNFWGPYCVCIAKHFVALDTAHHHSLSQTRTKHDIVQLNFRYPLVAPPANNEQIRVLNVDYVTQAFKHAQLVFIKSLAFPQ